MADTSKFSPDNGITIYDLKDKNGRIMSEQLIRDTVGWTGKNILKNTATSQTVNNVAYTVNADKSVTANNTASAQANLYITSKTVVPKTGTYIVSGLPSTGSMNTFRFYMKTEDSLVDQNIFNNYQVSLTAGQKFMFLIVIASGYATNNLTFKPMIRLATISDDTYEPYHDNVSTEITNVYKVMGEMGAKNLIPYPYADTTKTEGGITFTDNGDGSITISPGTATENAFFAFANPNHNFTTPKGNYRIIGGVSGSIFINYQTTNNDYSDTGSGVEFTLNSDYSFTSGKAMYIRVNSGTVISQDITIHPMLYHAEDTDTTWHTFAKTNKELTEYCENIPVDTKYIGLQSGYSIESNFSNAYRIGNIIHLRLKIKATTAFTKWTQTSIAWFKKYKNKNQIVTACWFASDQYAIAPATGYCYVSANGGNLQVSVQEENDTRNYVTIDMVYEV